MVATTTLSMLTYSLSSFGVIAFIYKLSKYIRIKNLTKSYFRDKTVLITGASSGLGKAIAEEFYPLGAQLILCARNEEELNKVKRSLMNRPGKEPEVLCLDVSSKLDAVKPKIEKLYEKFGRIDILINNAGISYRGESITCSDETLEKIMQVNFFGVIRLTNLVLSYMLKDNAKNVAQKIRRRNYSIVNVGSVQSYLAIPYRGPYCSSKHALLAYSDSIRGELYEHKNIQVLNAQPGYINTNVSINALTSSNQTNNANDDSHKNGFDPNYVAQLIIRSIVNKDKEVMIHIFLHRLAIWLRFYLPNVYFWVMFKKAKTLFNNNFQG